MYSQSENKHFNRFLDKFQAITFEEAYVVKNQFNEKTAKPIERQEELNYLSIQLNNSKKIYPIGKYPFENFHCLRIQVVFLGKPMLIDEFLVTINQNGNFIDKIICGGYSVNHFITFNRSSKIFRDSVIVTSLSNKHMKRIEEAIEQGNSNLIREIIQYKINKKGKFIKSE